MEIDDVIFQIERNYRNLLKIAKRMQEYVDSPADWQVKHAFVFGMVQPMINRLGFFVKWTDLNEGYEQEVRAYNSAVQDLAAEVAKLLGEDDGEPA